MNIKKFETEIVPYLKKLGFKRETVYGDSIYSDMVLRIKVFALKGFVVINYDQISIDTVNGNILTKKTTYKTINDMIGMLHDLPNSWVMFKNKGFKS